jgi:hypothetical protein
MSPTTSAVIEVSGTLADQQAGRSSVTFRITAAVFGAALVGYCIWAAQRHWFFADDFGFLASAQQPKDWWRTFFPFRGRLWWSYRPLTTDAFFFVGFRLFGLHPLGYLLISLGAHFARGLVVYRLARQLGLEGRVSAVTALLSVSRPPALMEVYWISVFQHIGANLLFLISVSAFLGYAQGGRTLYQLLSCITLALALLSNEGAATLWPVLVCAALLIDRFAISRRTIIKALQLTLPHGAITAAYLLLRLRLFGPVALPFPAHYYATYLGWNIALNYLRYVQLVFNDAPAAVLLVAALAIVSLGIAASRSNASSLRHVVLFCLAWATIVLVPFVGFDPSFAPPRCAIAAEAPLSLLFGVCLEVVVRRLPQRTAVIEISLLALLVVALPFRVLAAAREDPNGERAFKFVTLVRAQSRPVPEAVVVLYGLPGLGGEADVKRLHFLLFGDAALQAFYPVNPPRLVFQDMTKRKSCACTTCSYLKLLPGADVAIAEPALIGRIQR